MPAPGMVRLQKFLSDAGVASRRRCEELIEEGRVLVNDQVVDTLPVFIDPRRDRIIVSGNTIRVKPLEYFIVHKPRGVVCTRNDPAGRTRAVDLLPPEMSHLFVVGRLDADSSGLLLMTNDGELGQRITHPRYGVPKEYRVEVRGPVVEDVAALLERGVHLAEGRAQAAHVQITHRSRQRSILNITLTQGRNRQIRRMLARLDHRVQTLKRTRIGPVNLRGLPIGACRRLSAREIELLRQEVDPRKRKSAAGKSRSRPTTRTAPKKSANAKRPSTKRPTTKRPTTKRPAARPSAAARKKSQPPKTTRPRRRIVS